MKRTDQNQKRAQDLYGGDVDTDQVKVEKVLVIEENAKQNAAPKGCVENCSEPISD